MNSNFEQNEFDLSSDDDKSKLTKLNILDVNQVDGNDYSINLSPNVPNSNENKKSNICNVLNEIIQYDVQLSPFEHK